jgi:hypothetical protein
MKLRLTTGTLSVMPGQSEPPPVPNDIDQMLAESGWVEPNAPNDIDQMLAEVAWVEPNAPNDIDQMLAEVAWEEA